MNPSESARPAARASRDLQSAVGASPGEPFLFDGFDAPPPGKGAGEESPEVFNALVQGYLPFVRAIDLEGRIRLIPEAEYRQHKAAGVTQIPSTICLDPDRAGPARTLRHNPRKREPKHIMLARALVLLNEHPEWSNRRVARELGIHHSTLSKWPEFEHARQLNQRTRPVGRGRSRNPETLSYDRRLAGFDEE